MRGPTVRIQSEIRRLWRCPVCAYEARVSAVQTTVRCHCQSDRPFMKLVEQQRPARHVPEDLPPYFEYEEDGTEVLEDETTQVQDAPVTVQVEEPEITTAEEPAAEVSDASGEDLDEDSQTDA